MSGGRGSFRAAAMLTYGTTLAVGVLSLANVLVTSRVLGATGRGQFVFLTTIAMLTATLVSLGVEEATGNIAGREPLRRRSLGGTCAVLALALGMIGAGAVSLLVAVFPAVGAHANPGLRLLALAAIPLLVFQVYLQFLVRADYGFNATSAAMLVAPVANICVNGLLAATGTLTVGTAIATWVAAQAVSTGLLVSYVHRRLAGFGWPDRDLARRAVGFGVKAHTGRIMKTGNYRLDQWLLGAIAGPHELGLYSVAVAWSESLFYLPEALGAVMRPDVVRASARDAAQQAAKVFRVAVLLTAPFVVGLVVAAPLLCVTLLGSEFRGSILDLRVLAPGGFGMLALKLLANTLTAQRKPMLANAAIGVAFVATVALDLLLIPDHGALGAAVASTLSYTAGGIAVMIIFARSLEIGLRELVPGKADVVALRSALSRRSKTGHRKSDATQAGDFATPESQPTVSPPQRAS